MNGSAPVLVTGATGFVGRAVAAALAGRGAKLRLLVRPAANRRNLSGLQAELMEGDLLDAASLARAVAGCPQIFHVAADYRLWVPDPAVMFRTNVEGTLALMRAARAAGAERIVYTSSVAALGLNPDGRPADETTPLDPASLIGPYKRSKYLAEQAVREEARAGLPVVIVNPASPVGPGDIKPTPTGRMVLDAARGRLPAYVDTGLNVVHVEDVAAGHLAAAERGRIGESYILGGENLSLGALLTLIAEMAGRRPPRLRLPITPLIPLALVAEGLAKVTGRAPALTRQTLAMARKKMFFSSAKAEAELGYVARPVGQAIAEALAWFRAEGMLR
ncbi:MAG: NAD-dependent epimerase/dehydratase family protein [Rhodospirillales bacterium]|nr:NAD-dependent epimerase/dehydratase family protein [Rhodospirillales bacterium]